MQARVEVTEGPDAGRGVDLPLGARLVVGRADDAGLQLTDLNVSRRHCQVEHTLAGLVVEDLGSRGGTLVDGARPAGRAHVTAEAVVTLGTTRLRVARGAAATPPAVPGVRLQRRLGQGASGEVWQGTREPDGLPVAVKLLVPDADETTRRRFEREAALVATLQHPGIARVLALVRAGDRPCLVRELVAGPTVEERLAGGRLPVAEVVAMGAAVADALQHAHDRGVIHRDVKPGNVVLGPTGARLIDFDLARPAPQAELTRLTRTGDGLGSLSYVAPEQLASARDVDGRADVYGIGLTLYHAAGGAAPFVDVEPEDFLEALSTRGPRPLPLVAPDLPAALCDVIARAHALRPDDRWPRAADLSAALRSLR